MRALAILLFASLISITLAYTPMGGGVCECSECADCTDALNDNTDCYSEVKLISDLSSTTTCINNPRTENKTFNCQFHSITGNRANLTYGFAVLSNETSNITIRNCVIKSFFYGVFVSNSRQLIVRDSNISENAYAGIRGIDASGCHFENNILKNNTYANFFISNVSFSNFTDNDISYYETNYSVGFSVVSSTDNLFKNNDIHNLTNGFYIENSSARNIIDNNTIYNNSYGGIVLTSNSINNTISNNKINGVIGGIYLFQNSNNNSILHNDISNVYYAIYLYADSNNISYNNLSNGNRLIYLYSARKNVLSYNDIYNGTNHGIQLYNLSHNNVIVNNTIHLNMYGVYLDVGINENNSVIGNQIFENLYGINLKSSNNIIEKNLIYNSTEYGIDAAAFDCEISENEIYNNTRGLNIYNSSRITISNNIIYHNNNSNIQVYRSHDSLLYNNTAFDSIYSILITSFSSKINATENKCYNSSYCFYLVSNTQNVLTKNIANTSAYGIALYDSHENYIADNTVSDNGHGIYVRLSSRNNISNNIAYLNSNSFYLVDGSANNSFVNNTAYNSPYGFFITDVANTTIVGGNLFNLENGTYIRNSTTSLSNVHFYNNSKSFYASANLSSFLVLLSNVTFDNPSGNFENYTSLSITDVVDPDTAYSIDWTTNESNLPPRFRSFQNKYVKIKAENGAVSIDYISWHWLEDELLGGYYDENSFELWGYNNSLWTRLNDTPDTSTNTLSLADLNPSSDYGILEYNSSCMLINSSGDYYIKRNISGAPIDVTNIPGLSKACIVIASSDVSFDCRGYSIINNGTVDSAGIVINGSVSVPYSNITISNCSIFEYSYGAYVSHSNSVHLSNNTVIKNINGLFLNATNQSNLFKNIAYDNSNIGIYLISSSNNRLTGDRAYNNSNSGFFLVNSENLTITNSTSYNNNVGFQLSSTSGT
ncbi:MAG: right-handed parallel beta-helix repeat-containing protein, partial [Candidatus Bilamarchaeaceae archaeon]